MSFTKLNHVNGTLLQRVINTPWMIIPDYLDALVRALHEDTMTDTVDANRPGSLSIKWESAQDISLEHTGEGDAEGTGLPFVVRNGNAIISISGPIFHKKDMFTEFFGLPTYEGIREKLSLALNSGSVSKIILDLTTPGGTGSGVFDLVDFIHNEIAPNKETIAFANGMAASAGFMIGRAAPNFFVDQGAFVGSVGVIMELVNLSEMAEKQGVKIEHITAGKFKAAGSEFKELTPDDRAYLQGLVDSHMSIFVQKVSEMGGLSEAAVRDTEARVFIGKEAVDLGLVDGISTLEQLINGGEKMATEKDASGVVKQTPDVGTVALSGVIDQGFDTEVVSALKEQNAELLKTLTSINTNLAESRDENKKLNARMDANDKKTELAKHEENAKKLTAGLPIEAKDIQQALVILAENPENTDLISSLEAGLKRTGALLQKDNSLGELGSGLDTQSIPVDGQIKPGQATMRLEMYVREMQKHDPTLDEHKARLMVAEKHPDLYASYVQNQRNHLSRFGDAGKAPNSIDAAAPLEINGVRYNVDAAAE